MREEFSSVHGQFLPEDVCPWIHNPPTRWTVKVVGDESVEVLPGVAQDLLDDVSCVLFDSCTAI